ncbi:MULTISPECIES: hypothetical protein [unclassified Microcoleus]|uniref:hypothetical protein n=1 Tax=unclassified Microcoleus TaxID=2642155 RepID=UPI002FD65343
MAICKYAGGGITAATGKAGLRLGSALGLFSAVDVGTRLYTGYGLLETLSVPYIECPDGSYASAIEWYGSGLKCPKKPETTELGIQPPSPQSNQALSYNDAIEALGGGTTTFFGAYSFGFNLYGSMLGNSPFATSRSGHYDTGVYQSQDKLGNVFKRGTISDGMGSPLTDESNPGAYSDTGRGGFFLDPTFNQTWNGISGGSYWFINYQAPLLTRTKFAVPYMKRNGYFRGQAPYTLLGIQASIPSNYEKAPPVANISPLLPGFTPTPPPPKEDCEEMACPCLTKKDIEDAVKKALGLKAFAPEKLIREIGAKMFVAPGPSLVPVVPKDLVEAIAALVAANYMRQGLGRYPVMMPGSLINDNSVADAVPAQPIENYAEWFEWFIKQQDAIQGEWPVEIAIVDGAKRQPLKFENISEAFAELSGLMIQTATDADAAVAVSSHAAVAATKAHTASVIAQKNVECLIRFFGVRTGYGSIFIDSAITPMDSDNPTFNLKKFLTPSKQPIAFLTDVDPFDFQAVLDRILRNSEIAKSAVALDAKSGLVGDYARNQRKYDAAETKREAEKELEKLQASINAANPEFKVRIRVDTPAPTGDITGNNFVIKRPKTADE